LHFLQRHLIIKKGSLQELQKKFNKLLHQHSFVGFQDSSSTMIVILIFFPRQKHGHVALEYFQCFNFSFQGKRPPSELATIATEANNTFKQ
jgi:hypothetical protein